MRDSPFVDYLESHSEDRAMLAALRRGLGKKEGHVAMYPYVVPFLPSDEVTQRRMEWVYFTVAALFGYHHYPAESGVTIGEAMRKLERNDSLEKRFLWLLDSEVDELPMRLKSVVSLLKSKNIGFDYRELFYDLSYWGHPERFVQLKWARDFYANENQNKE